STAERCETADSRSSTLMRIVYRLIAQRREDRGGKGSHRNFLHPSGVKITLSGAPGDNAKHYQERPQAYNSKSSIMSKTSDRYVKVVAWSEEDQCYVGRCPGLMLGGVHGSDELAVYAELCEAVDECIQLHE